MTTELEVKILDIDVAKVTDTLQQLGATKIAERYMKRYTYDLVQDQEGLEKRARLRDMGDKTTLCIKEIHHDGVDGTKETEIVVDDLEKTHLLMQKLGHTAFKYEENKRISYKIDDVDVEIDTWPLIPTYMEVEGPSVEKIQTVVEALGYRMEDTTSIGVHKVYQKYGLDILRMKVCTFEKVEYF